MLSAAFLAGSFTGASGDNHDATYYACLFGGSLSQVNSSGPPANCGRGIAIEWTSFGGTVDASAIEDGSIGSAKLNEELRQEIKCGAFPHWEVDWSGCDLNGANLSHAGLIDANLSNAFLSRADLTSASIVGADLTNANLTSAILNDASLYSANLTDANLTNASLIETYMDSANLTNANLTGANLIDAVLAGANLTGVVWNNTICPDGTNSDDNGNTCINNL